METVNPKVEILDNIDELTVLKKIEASGRVCYKSENLTTDDSCYKFVEKIIERGHEAVLEHVNITCKFICDRGVMAELTRHRIASFCVESSRYCNYSKDKFSNNISVVRPQSIKPGTEEEQLWKKSCEFSEKTYMQMLKVGVSPEIARSVLPTCLKTEIVMTANLRQWRNVLKLRTSNAAHPDMRFVMNGLLCTFKSKLPTIFQDI